MLYTHTHTHTYTHTHTRTYTHTHAHTQPQINSAARAHPSFVPPRRASERLGGGEERERGEILVLIGTALADVKGSLFVQVAGSSIPSVAKDFWSQFSNLYIFYWYSVYWYYIDRPEGIVRGKQQPRARAGGEERPRLRWGLAYVKNGPGFRSYSRPKACTTKHECSEFRISVFEFRFSGVGPAMPCP